MELLNCTLYILIDGEPLPVAPGWVEMSERENGGGIFTTHESDRNSTKKTIDHHRIGTISPERIREIRLLKEDHGTPNVDIDQSEETSLL